jgi:hypothetical protein
MDIVTTTAAEIDMDQKENVLAECELLTDAQLAMVGGGSPGHLVVN